MLPDFAKPEAKRRDGLTCVNTDIMNKMFASYVHEKYLPNQVQLQGSFP